MTPSEVTRIVDGRVVQGGFVEPEAYASFLRGAVAEESGDLPTALASYQETGARDPSDPEVWTRIADVTCRLRPADPAADRAIAHALELDATYAPAWETKGRCEAARGGKAALSAASASYARAAAFDPKTDDPQLYLARAEDASAHALAARDRLLALTLARGQSLAAWEALAAWSRAHGDVALWAHALTQAVRVAPSRRRELGDRAVLAAGEGELAAARAVAAAAVDAEGPQVSAAAARLAVDEALVRKDVERVRLRATRGRLGLEEAAARAMLLGLREVARALAEPVFSADPSNAGARMVLASAATDAAEVERVLATARPSEAVPFSAFVVFAGHLADQVGVGAARAFAAAMPLARVDSGDGMLSNAAAELAARGVLPETTLSAEARIQLAARQRVPPPDPSTLPLSEVDARHRLLALALLRPTDRETLALAHALSPAGRRDALIATALAKIALARGTSLDAREAGRLSEIDPREPIAAAAAVDVAKSAGDASAVGPVRARLTALARTAAERALASE